MNVKKFTSNELNKANTWQIGTGDNTRNYFKVFLRFGVALVGPGNPGPEGLQTTENYYKMLPNVKNWGKVLQAVKPGNWIIARKGKSIILGIGKVVSEYKYSTVFGDVEGWDLQHLVRVEWYVPNLKESILKLNGKKLGGSTLQCCYHQEVFDSIYKTSFKRIEKEIDHFSIPEPYKISIDEMSEKLIDLGVRIGDVENVKASIQRIIKLTNWYTKNDYHVSESEIIAFLILPLIIALGWSEQKIKLEYGNIDLALFNQPFTGDYSQHPEIIIEAKKFDNGLAFTQDQIKTYGKRFNTCKKFVTTNGFRYNFYNRNEEELELVGNFNLTRLIQRDYVNKVKHDSIDTMILMSNYSK